MKTKNVKKIIVGGLILLNSGLVIAQNGTENAVFMPGPSTEEATFIPGPNTDSIEVVKIKTPEMHEAGSVFSGSNGLETPSWDVPVQPAPPVRNPSDMTPEEKANLVAVQKAAYLLSLVRAGKLPAGVEIRVLSTKRSAQEDLVLYSMSIALHVRALAEGKRGDYYVEMIKNGKSLVEFDFAARSFEQLQRDVDVCGTGFELFNKSGKCSYFRTVKEAAEHHYASIETIDERNKTIEKLQASNAMLADANKLVGDILVAKMKEIDALKRKLRKGKK